ncbi:hypothetical protein VB773_21130 [Haloarculaceae archaeon H-GB2-1]|nr:hypothetical protein [Haloarculaceae archaeon H-GB1-1]MEA5389377.1 hypothetical protein [Haloarculaceae archaeon H-GB11]MEA5409824.1 hypothetical protein [Haloarculaceae archaeon H-GB2-1]
MTEAWIQLQCPQCGETWEANPSKLPTPGAEFRCRHCGATRPTSEFMRATRDLEVLEAFHEA